MTGGSAVPNLSPGVEFWNLQSATPGTGHLNTPNMVTLKKLDQSLCARNNQLNATLMLSCCGLSKLGSRRVCGHICHGV